MCVYSIIVTKVVNATRHICIRVLLGYHVLINLFISEWRIIYAQLYDAVMVVVSQKLVPYPRPVLFVFTTPPARPQLVP